MIGKTKFNRNCSQWKWRRKKIIINKKLIKRSLNYDWRTIEFNQKEVQVILTSLLELKLTHKREIDRGLKNNQDVDYYQKELLIIEDVMQKMLVRI